MNTAIIRKMANAVPITDVIVTIGWWRSSYHICFK